MMLNLSITAIDVVDGGSCQCSGVEKYRPAKSRTNIATHNDCYVWCCSVALSSNVVFPKLTYMYNGKSFDCAYGGPMPPIPMGCCSIL